VWVIQSCGARDEIMMGALACVRDFSCGRVFNCRSVSVSLWHDKIEDQCATMLKRSVLGSIKGAVSSTRHICKNVRHKNWIRKLVSSRTDSRNKIPQIQPPM